MPPGEVIGTAFVEIRPDTEGFAQDAKSKIGGSLQAVVGAFSTAVVGRKIGEFFKGAFDEAQQAAKVGAQTAAVLKSTGEEAGVTSEHIGDLANSLSDLSAIDDDVIQQGENVLLTFTSVRNEVGKGNDVFDRATKAALNMSVALGTDLQGGIIQVGKALNDPIAGITALSRVGVSFTEQQKDQIKVLQESGNVLGAQKIVLAELEKEFGGAAKSQATDTARLAVAYGNLKESIGTALLPVISSLAKVLTPIAGFLSENKIAATALAVVISGALLLGLAGWTVGAARATVANLGLGASTAAVTEGAIDEAAAATSLGAGLGLATGIMGAAAIAGIGLASALGQSAHGLNLTATQVDRLTDRGLRRFVAELQAAPDSLVKFSDVVRNISRESTDTARRMVEAADLPRAAREKLLAAIEKEERAQQRAAAAAHAGGAAAETQTEKVKTLKEAFDDLVGAMDDHYDKSLSAEGAAISMDRAIEGLNTTLKDTAITTLEGREAFNRAEESIVSFGKSIFESKGGTDNFEQATRDEIGALEGVRNTLAPGSPLRTFLDQYIYDLGTRIPRDVLTEFRLRIANQTGLSLADLDYLDSVPIFQAASGGYFPARPGGYLVNVAEGGKDEVVMNADQVGGGGSGITFNLYGPQPPDPVTFGHLVAKTNRVHSAMAGR